MKPLQPTFVALTMLLLASAPGLMAQGEPGCCQQHGKAKASSAYDVSSIETLSGKVTAVEGMEFKRGMGHGVLLVVKTQKESINVHLGPAWYLEEKDIRFSKGDQITVKGSRITFDGKPAIVATQVTRGKEDFVLRGDDGMPAWCRMNSDS